jgi:hypothetical protein
MAGRLDVVTYGENDKYLSLNPEGTLFHKQVTKRPNFSINSTDINPTRESIGFGKTIKFTIPQNVGDLLKSITLTIKADDIPNEWNLYYQDGAGIAVIEYADLIIGGTVIERLDSNYITINKTYFNNSRQQEGIENITGLIPSSVFSSWYGCRKTFSTKNTQKQFDFQIDLPFYFYNTTELTLPLCAITKQEVEVEIKFRDLKDILFSKTSDIYREESVNFPFPTYYDQSWIPNKNVIFLELIKGWNRTSYSYFKYSGVPWYDNPGANMTNAKLGQNGLGIHKYNKKHTTRDYYPYSETYIKPSWSILDFFKDNGARTYDVSDWYSGTRVIPEHFTYSDMSKTFFHSLPGLASGSVAMRIITGDKEFSKNATLINPYMSTWLLSLLDKIYPDTTSYASFSIEKTGPNMLNDVYNYQLENVYGGSDNPFTDIGTQNEKSVPINWLNHGLVACCIEIGEVLGIYSGPSDLTNFSAYDTHYYRIVRADEYPYEARTPPYGDGNPTDFPLGGGFVRIFRHFPVGEGYNDAWTPETSISSETTSEIKSRLIELENIESGKVVSSDVVTLGLLELHWPLHNYARDLSYGTGPDTPKFMGSMNEPMLASGYTGTNTPLNIYPYQLSSLTTSFGRVTRITSAGKAIVATLGDPDWPNDLRMFTWIPNGANGCPYGSPQTPGYTTGSPVSTTSMYSGIKTDYFAGPAGTYRLAWPNTRIVLDSTSRGTNVSSRRKSDLQMSDYWETNQYPSDFLDGRTAIQDNGNFALFWGHVRNITVAYSYVGDTESKTIPGAVRIYEWNFHDWTYYREYKREWDKTFSLIQTLTPPDTPTYNFNFGRKIAISRTSQLLVVSEPHWVPPTRLNFSKSDNVNWNVGRIQVYKKNDTPTVTSVYNITASGGKFYINSVEQATIELIEGVTYTFNNPTSGGSLPAHPFKFSTTSDGTHAGGSEYTFTGTVNTVIPVYGAPEGTYRTQFTVPVGLTGTQFYYYCSIHPGMGGSVNVVVAGGRYELHQTIYPELPSLADRKEHARKYQHALYTSWNDPIQKRWEFGKTLDLSDDDKTLIVGAESNTTLGSHKSPTETNGGWVSIYQLNDSGNFDFKSIISQKVDEDADAEFGSDNIAITTDGNDIAVSASNADWEPASELPFKDTSFDPLNNVPNVPTNESCGNIQLFSRDTITPKNYNDINIEINTCKLKLELIHLDKLEQTKIKNTPITQIITQLQVNKFNWREYQGINYDDDFVQESQNNQFKLNFCNPVKELFFVVKKSNNRALELLQDSNVNTSEVCFFQGVTDFDGFVRNYGNRETNDVFTSSKYSQPVMESIKSISLTLDDEEVIPVNGIGEFPSHFMRVIPSSKYHTHTALNRRIYLWSFGTRPESWKPSGQLNFSTVKNQILTVEGFKTGWTHQHDISVYAKSYNVMQINNGTTQLLYPLIANRKSESMGNLRNFPRPFINEVFDGNQYINHERYQSYFDPGISLSPDFTFDSSNNLNINVIGSYSFEYSVVNEHGNTNEKGFTRTVNVIDTVAPVVSLNFLSANPINLIYNDTVTPVYFQPYIEYSAVSDTSESIITTVIRTPIGGGASVTVAAVNPIIEGVYTVTYTATDGGGNIGTNTRTVIVSLDTTPPLISLTIPSANPINLIYNDTVSPVYFQSYTELGATSNGGETVVIDSSAVNTNTAGTYIVTYTATDTAGNIGTTTRSVIVSLDTTAPLISLTNPSANPINLIYNDTVSPVYFQSYTEFGATSNGGETVVIDSSSINLTTAGTYTVTYTATDITGNIGTNTRTVIVSLDTTAPLVTLNTPSYNNVNLIYNNLTGYSQTYTEYGATSNGGEAIIITLTRRPISGGTVVSVNSVNTSVTGIYTVTYTATSVSGNSGTNTRTVTVTQDTTAPLVTLTNPNENPVRLTYNSTVSPTYSEPYVEYGATADSGETVVIDSSAINLTTAGTYTVTYTATDIAGNIGTTTRTVIVTQDTTAPLVTLINPSENPVRLTYNSTVSPIYSEPYVEYGATAVTGETVVIDNSAVNITTEGTYTVTYTATDTAGNIGTTTRTVIVTEDDIPPVITLNNAAANPINLIFNDSVSPTYIQSYTEYGATADGGQTVTIDASAIQSTTQGTYNVVYSATDIAGNTGTIIRQVIYTRDTSAPIINLNTPSYNPVDLVYNSGNGYSETYTEYGATSDGGEAVTKVVRRNGTVVSAVNPTQAGTYVVTYSATDSAGNIGNNSRTITVTNDTVAPVLNLQGSSYIKVVQNYGGSLGIPNPPVTINSPDQSLSYTINNPINMATPGTYYLSYSATDRALNVGTVYRTVQVYSTSAATASFTLNGGNQSLTQCGTYTDGGVTSVVADTTNTPVYSSGNLNTSTSGSYTINWVATSKVLGGNSLTRSRTVTVNAISFSPSTTIQSFSYYEPLVDSSSPWNSNVTWYDTTTNETVSGRTVQKVTRSYRPLCNNQANQQLSTRVIRNYYQNIIVQRPTTNVSGGDYIGSLGNHSQATLVAHTTITSRAVSSTNYSKGLIARLGNFSINAEYYSGASRIMARYTDNSRNASCQVYVGSTQYNNTKIICSLTGTFTVGGAYVWNTTYSPIYTTYTNQWGQSYQVRTGTNVTHYWRKNYSMSARLRVYKYTGTSYNITTDRLNGSMDSSGNPQLTYVGGSTMSQAWYDGGNNTTTLNNTNGESQFTARTFVGSNTAYYALSTYRSMGVRNLAPWSATNGNSIYILDRAHNDYL